VHGDVGAAKIDLALGGTDFPKAKLEKVRAAIRTHMFNRDPGRVRRRAICMMPTRWTIWAPAGWRGCWSL